MQSQCNSIENKDVKFLLIYIRKIQKTARFRILITNEIVPLTKAIVRKKELGVSIKKISYIIS